MKWWGIAKVAQIKQACDLEVSGCGGIFKTEDALEYILIGCPTVQLVSSLYFKGERVFPEILSGIESFMDRKGYNSIDDFKGKLLPQLKAYKDVPHEETMLDLRSVPTPVLPKFDVDECTFCMQCVISCIHDAISADKDKGEIGVDDEACVGCGFCAGICPTGAISIVHAKTGKTVWTGDGAVDTSWIDW